MSFHDRARIARDMARVDDVHTAEELGALYADIVGYDAAAEDPSASADELRALLLGYLHEECKCYGLDPADVGLA